MSAIRKAQLDTCKRLSLPPLVPRDDEKLGVALNVRDHALWPLNGLRHPPVGDTSGWYIWAGDKLGADDDFFQPLHVIHLEAGRSELMPYLGLPSGWRFLLAPQQEDVWYDESLLAPGR